MSHTAEDAIRQVEATNKLYAEAVLGLAEAQRRIRDYEMHEGRTIELPIARRCGDCADSEPIALPTRKNIACRSELSECQNHLWTVDHGCPWHRAERA